MFPLIQIEIIAGKILNLLEDQNRPLTLEEIVFYLKEPAGLIEEGVGLLLRENMADTVVLEKCWSHDEHRLFDLDEIFLCAS